MPKFKVYFEETSIFTTVVEAESREAAEDIVAAQKETDDVVVYALVERTLGCEIDPVYETEEVR